MTQSPISSQPSSNGKSNPPINSESLDWESRMAQLVGLEETYQAPDNSPVKSDDLQSEIDEPQLVQTQQELSSNPFAKAALVGTGTLIMVMIAGIFLTQVMGGSAKKNRVQTLAPEVKPQPSAKPRIEELTAEVETLKTKLALAEQAKDVKAAQQQLRRLRNPPRKPTVTPSPSPTKKPVASVRTPTPVKTVYREVPAQIPFPAPQPIPFNNQPPTVEITPPTPPTPPNPLQEWSRLAKLGSYGEVSGKQKSGVNNSNFAPQPKREIEFKRPTAKRPRVRRRSISSSVSRRKGKSTVIGSSAKGVLTTAVFGETTRSRIRSRRKTETNADSENNVFVVRLAEPLKTQDNDIALPEDTELLVKLNSFSQEGLAQLQVTKVIIQENNKITEKNVSPGGLAIRGVNGKPLMAKKYGNGSSSSFLNDAGLFVLGGVGKAAEIVNRQTTETSTVNNTTTTTTEGDNNALVGILEGGVKNVVPQITRRNQRAAARQRNKRSNIWFLPEGTEVEVFVNKRMQF